MKTCETCGCPLSGKNTPEDMMQEFKEKLTPYGLSSDAEMSVVCDSCYKQALEWIKKVSPEQLKIWEDEARTDGTFKKETEDE